jgi:hypothetical protein
MEAPPVEATSMETPAMDAKPLEAKPRYANPEYQAAHDAMFSNPLYESIKTVLPPDVSQEDFDRALAELREAVGKDAVFTGSNLKEYVDPYEIPESGHERKVPSAAVWLANQPLL